MLFSLGQFCGLVIALWWYLGNQNATTLLPRVCPATWYAVIGFSGGMACSLEFFENHVFSIKSAGERVS